MRSVREQHFEGFLLPQDKSKDDFIYIPFEVPEGCEKIEIEYSYTSIEKSECVIDIGVFEPGPIGFLEAGKTFRGWSGSSKKIIAISRSSATPGYIPCNIEPGTWKIVLGLYKVPQAGCKYSIKVRMLSGERAGHEPKRKKLQNRERFAVTSLSGWLKGDFHVHSVHSDGDSTLEKIAKAAAEEGLNFVAVTDHNTISHVPECGMRRGVFLLPGEEVTTYYGHMNVFGISEWVDFRIRGREELERLVDHMQKKGYLASVNHPKPFGPPWQLGGIEKIGFIEVWQGNWALLNYMSSKLLDELLSRGCRIRIVGGSDTHSLKRKHPMLNIGHPTTWVYVNNISYKNILDAVKAGMVTISESPKGPFLWYEIESADKGLVKALVEVHGARGAILRFISMNEVVYVEKIESERFVKKLRIKIPDKATYVRFDVADSESQIDEANGRETLVKAYASPKFIMR